MSNLNISWNEISASAVAQIAVLYVVIYAILKAAKGTRFGQALMGVGILAAAMFAFTYVLHFEVLSTILKALLVYLAISTVVIFQPEIRRILSQVGAFGYLEKPTHAPDGTATPEFIVATVAALAARRKGALIAFERGISLRSYEETGVRTDAVFSRELIESIFEPPLPLHDGGVTVRNGRLAAAHCVFPVSNNPALISSGMRHRAAVGLSEDTDAIVVVVSEETGVVSVAHNGKLYRFPGSQRDAALLAWVRKASPRGKNGKRGLFASLFGRMFRRGGAK